MLRSDWNKLKMMVLEIIFERKIRIDTRRFAEKEKEDLYGWCDWPNCVDPVIFVAPGLSPKTTVTTCIHELSHACIASLAENDQKTWNLTAKEEEDVCDRVSRALWRSKILGHSDRRYIIDLFG